MSRTQPEQIPTGPSYLISLRCTIFQDSTAALTRARAGGYVHSDFTSR